MSDRIGPGNWLDDSLHPKLQLDGGSITFTYQAVSPDYGPGVPMMTFKVECLVQHATGVFIYSADDLTMISSAFADFAEELHSVLEGKTVEATLASVARELVVAVTRAEKIHQMKVRINEWQGPFEPETVASAGCASLHPDRMYRWARELNEYGRRLREWALKNQAH